MKVLGQEKPDVIFLMETKMTAEEIRRLNERKIHFFGCFTVDCERTTKSRRGGLCMLWKEPYMLHLVSFSLHHIFCKVVGIDGEADWMCTGIYG